NQMLIAKAPVCVQQLSNKRLWTGMDGMQIFRLDSMCGSCGLTAQILASPGGERWPNDLDVAENAAASAGSYGQRIEGKRCANRYPTLEIPTQYIFGAFLTAKRAGS